MLFQLMGNVCCSHEIVLECFEGVSMNNWTLRHYNVNCSGNPIIIAYCQYTGIEEWCIEEWCIGILRRTESQPSRNYRGRVEIDISCRTSDFDLHIAEESLTTQKPHLPKSLSRLQVGRGSNNNKSPFGPISHLKKKQPLLRTYEPTCRWAVTSSHRIA